MRAIVLASTALVLSMPAYAAPTVKLGGSVTATEGQAVPMPIIKTGSGRAKFGIRTVPDTATEADYAPVNRVLSPYGSTVEAISTADDTTYEGSERLKVQLYPVAGSKTVVDQTPQYITLLDNDPPPPPPPVDCPDGSQVPAGEICPEPPPPSGDVLAESVEGAAAIASNFDVNLAIKDMGLPSVESGDILGAFRFICGAGHLSYDDPIVYPGQPGKSHLHQFFGNTEANAGSTYASLRGSGDSTCNFTGKGVAANRTGYWVSAMLDGQGNAVKPDHITFYYKHYPKGSPYCDPASSLFVGICRPIPNGLRFVFGYDMVSGKAPSGTQAVYFNCYGTPDSVSGRWPSIKAAAPNCKVGGRIIAILPTPTCWDGKRLDSPNHRDHMAAIDDRTKKCPLTHPYVIPRATFSAVYYIRSTDDLTQWRLSSDEMHPELDPGTTFHADYFEAWDPQAKAFWQAGCIDAHMSCVSGNMGGGKGLIGAHAPTYYDVTGKLFYSNVMPDNLRKVPLSAIPH